MRLCLFCQQEIVSKRRKRYCNTVCYKKHYVLLHNNKLRKDKAKYHQEHKADIIARVKTWRKMNPGKAATYNRAYKKRKRNGRAKR